MRSTSLGIGHRLMQAVTNTGTDPTTPPELDPTHLARIEEARQAVLKGTTDAIDVADLLAIIDHLQPNKENGT